MNSLASWRVMAGMLAVLALAGCSLNKTGKQWSLAQINPFKKSEPTAPYPQKPSAFATPSPVPGENQGQLATGSSTQGSSLYPRTSPGVYSGPQTSGATPSIGTSSVPNGSPLMGTGTSRAGYSAQNTRPRYDPTAFGRVQGQAIQAQPVGTALATDNGRIGPGVDSVRTASGNVTVGGQWSTSSAPSSVTAGAVVPTAGENVPVSYNTTTLPSQTASQNQGQALTGSRTNIPASQSVNPGGAAQAPSGGASADWSQLVGDRYAQLYRQHNAPSNPTSGWSPGGSNYTPGNTGYVPGQTPNPPGNTSYQPGNTGYQPPGVPPYSPPYAASNPTPGMTQPSGAAPQPQTAPGEYRPGSTKTYVPRTATGTLGIPASGSYGESLPSSNTTAPTTGAEGFRL